jgi:hypothetical protein
VRTGQAGNHRILRAAGDLAHSLEIAFRGNRKTGLDDVDTHVIQHFGDLELLLEGHGCAGALFAVTQGGVENNDAVLVGRRKAAVLAFVTLALLISAGLDSIGFAMAGAGVLAMAMGAENSVFQRDGEVTIGLTYMTGTLVKMGQRIAGALLGGPKLAFLRHFVLWLGLLSGAIAGAIAHGRIGLDAIWLAAGAAALFTLVALFMPERD